jgi:hypothetical protein
LNETCIKKELKLRVEVLKNNRVKLIFSESLNTSFNEDDLAIYVHGKKVRFKVVQVSEKEFVLDFGKDFIVYVGKTKATINFKNKIQGKDSSYMEESEYQADLEIKQEAKDAKEVALTFMKVIYAILAVLLLVLIVYKGNTGSVWIAITHIQLMSYSLLMNIEIPPTLYNYLLVLRPVGIFPNIYKSSSSLNQRDFSVEEPFLIFGYKTSYFLTNTGELFFAFLLLSCILFFVTLGIFFFNKDLKYFAVKVSKDLWGNSMMRFLILGYFDIVIPSVISANHVKLIQLSNKSTLASFNSFCGVFFLVIKN